MPRRDNKKIIRTKKYAENEKKKKLLLPEFFKNENRIKKKIVFVKNLKFTL